MKKILGLVAAMIFTAFSYAQSTVAFTDAGEGYDKTATTSFNFLFSPDHTEEEIQKGASYYESYFTVAITPEGTVGNKVTITLVEDNPMARRVVLRMFVNLEIGSVNVNGVEMDREDFVKEYIFTEN